METNFSNNPKGTRSRYIKSTQSQVYLEQGRLQPQALDMEEAVLGAMMLENQALTNAVDVVKVDFFYKPEHRVIFEAIYMLFQDSQPVDILTVTSKLKEIGKLEEAGGAYKISQLTSRVASAANVEYYARIVAQNYIKRELIRIAADINNNAYNETLDVLDMLDEAERDLLAIGEKSFQTDYADMQALVKEAIGEIESAKNAEGGLGISASAVPSGYQQLDRITNGWQRSTLVILAARPAMGKTAFALSMARNIAVEQGKAIAFFSLEMSAVELVTRLISSETGLSSQKLKTGDLRDYEWTQLTAKTSDLAKAPIFIDDSPSLNMFELRAKCRRLKQKHDIQMIFIDYLQLMQGSPEAKGNREQEISKISRQLKSLAKELKIPVLAMSQLSRAVESRSNGKIPQLSDLRESGAIEQDADIVMFIHRPEYYGTNVDEDGKSTLGMADILIEKHRSGPTGKARLRFDRDFARFRNLDYSDEFDGTFTQDDSIAPNEDFENRSFLTVESKMNKNTSTDLPEDNTPNF